MAMEKETFLQKKFLHLFDNFDHGLKGFITKQDADIHRKQLEDILRHQLAENGAKNEEIEQRISEFTSHWLPGALKYFAEMSRFAREDANKITRENFVTFNISIRNHILQNDKLPPWFEDSLRESFAKCWASNEGIVMEEGLELLPGVTKMMKGKCHQRLTDNNNTKIDISKFLQLIKDYYSVEDSSHVSKYIHGYE